MSNTRKRIAVDLLAILRGATNGGAKLLALDLLEGLSAHWDLTCFCRQDAEAEISARLGTVVKTVPIPRPADLASAYAAEVTNSGSFAINFFPMQHVSLSWPETPVVSIVHDLQFADLPQNFSPLDHAARVAAFRTCIELSDLIVTVSEFSSYRIQMIAGIDSKRIEVIYNSLKRGRAAEGTLDRLGLVPKGYFIYPANLWPHKNHERLLDGYRAYREVQAEPLDLVLTGDPGMAPIGLVEALKAQPGIVLVGFLDRAELLAALQGASALVFPSLYEGFGMPLIEAMAAKIPIICSHSGSLPEIAGPAALIFDGISPEAMAESMVRIASDDGLRSALVSAGQQRLFELGDFPRMRNAYNSALKAVLDVPASSSAEFEGVDRLGWAGPVVHIKLTGQDPVEQVQLTLAVPTYLPVYRLVLSISCGPRRITRRTLWSGQEETVDVCLLPGERSISIQASDSFEWREVLDVESERRFSYLIKKTSTAASGRRAPLWPAEAGRGKISGTNALLYVLAGEPEEGLAVIAVGVPKDPVNATLIPVVSPISVRFGWKLEALQSVPPTSPATQITIPPSRSLPAFESEVGVHAIMIRARAQSAPAVIPSVRTQRGFSVVIPSFNQGRFISRTIDSVMCQDGVLEVLVFDAGSTDQTLDILAAYGSAISWTSGEDEGQAHAVNKGLAKAKGEYIAWINSDDTYAPGAFAHVAKIFASKEAVGVVYGDADHINENDQFIEPYPTADFDASALYDNCFICQPATFFRRELVATYGGLRQSLRYCLDYEFWLRLSAAGVRFERCRKLLAHSRMYLENKTLGESLYAYFETADLMIRGLGHLEGKWVEHFSNAAADHLTNHCGIPRPFALREARRLAATVWLTPTLTGP
jgi:glycosyltransferase involved in cell wall biosynthesis